MPTKRSFLPVLRKVKLLLLDVDGVMTDGGIYYSDRGEVMKKFNTKDGYGLIKVQRAGVKVGIITGRMSGIIRRRAKELGIVDLYQNQDEKIEAYKHVRRKYRLRDEEVAFIGDDEPDLPVLRVVGFSAAPSDAASSVHEAVDYVCRRPGGRGAVREVIDLVLEAKA